MKYRKKPVVVEAEKFEGQEIEGMVLVKPKLIFDKHGELFYLQGEGNMAKDWLTVKKDKNGKYESFPFSFYEIKSGEIRDTCRSEELGNIYCNVFGWKTFPRPTGLIKTLEGSMIVSWGDFVIKGVKGEFYPCKPDIFEETYEKV